MIIYSIISLFANVVSDTAVDLRVVSDLLQASDDGHASIL